jgi:hypothetical protein
MERKLAKRETNPITVTSIGSLFLFRVVDPVEMSSVTWSFEKAKGK